MGGIIRAESRVLKSLQRHARTTPERVALAGVNISISYAELDARVEALAVLFAERQVAAIGLFMDNTPAWVVSDLAALSSLTPVVPVPMFFSPGQVEHLIADSGLELILTDQPGILLRILDAIDISVSDHDSFELAGSSIHAIQLEHPFPCPIPAEVAKVTYTSGTTGDPRGVCLSRPVMEDVAKSLRQASCAQAHDRHLCALPLATLLENIGGIYVPLLAGATCILPGLAAVGMSGATGLDPARFLQALVREKASTCIMIPQMLLGLVSAIAAGGPRPSALRYAAVGGAPVSPTLLKQASELHVPVYEGYGLSEAASVVAVNGPHAHKAGSVGRPLAHVKLGFADDGEILVAGSLFSGYLGEVSPALRDGFWPTGDMGYLDTDGFLHITGRKKHIFITAFGRNVSPEWVERELTVQPAIAQAVVFGEARPSNVAVLVPRRGADDTAVQVAVDAANAMLPDYARIRRWHVAGEAFSIANGQWTGTGRPRRDRIWQAYRKAIETMDDEER